MCAFLLIVIFGHCLNDFGGATSGMRDFALSNLLCVLVVYAIGKKDDPLSLERLWTREARSPASSSR